MVPQQSQTNSLLAQPNSQRDFVRMPSSAPLSDPRQTKGPKENRNNFECWFPRITYHFESESLSQKVCVPATGKLLWLSSRDSPSANLKTGQKTQPPKARPILFEVPGNVQGPFLTVGWPKVQDFLPLKCSKPKKWRKIQRLSVGFRWPQSNLKEAPLLYTPKKRVRCGQLSPPKKSRASLLGGSGSLFWRSPELTWSPPPRCGRPSAATCCAT